MTEKRAEINFAMQGSRVGHALRVLGMTVPEMARKSGILEVTLKQAVHRGTRSCSWLEDILPHIPDELVSHGWLRTGRGVVPVPVGNVGKGSRPRPGPQKEAAQPGPAPERYRVPRLALTSVGLGRGQVDVKVGSSQDHARTFAAGTLSAVPVDQRNALVFEEMPDSSMVPYLMPDEAFVVDPSDTNLAPTRLYAVLCGRHVTVRRAEDGPDGPQLAAQGSRDAEEVEAVLGRVVARAGAAL